MAVSIPPDFEGHINSLPQLDFKEFQQAHELPSPNSIRLHPIKSRDEFQSEPTIPWCIGGRYLSQRPDFTLDPLFHAGAYYVQEASSMSIESILHELFPSEKEIAVLDLCAAPGGKSTLIASWLNNKGLLVSNEVIRARAGILKENMDRWGYANVIVSNNDPRQFGKLPGIFDIVVVDAPCSGSGMFRKDPKSMDHWSLEAVDHCSARQKRILSDVWPSVKQGGYLVYSTCSYSEAEDEEICQWMVEQEHAELIPITSFEKYPEIVRSSSGYRFYPNKVKGEGFFVALLRKNAPANDNLLKPAKMREIPAEISAFLEPEADLIFHQNHLGDCAINAYLGDYLPSIEKHLHTIKCGIKLGEIKGKNFIPDHELAMSTSLNSDVPEIELSREEALRYLKKEAIPNSSGQTGWHVLGYLGRGLGWGNALPNRINNGLPKSWRIRKEIE